MNFSSFLGVTLVIAVVYGAVEESGMDPAFFLNFHGLVIVAGGTFAVTAICYPLTKVFSLLKIFFLRVLGSRKLNYQATIEEILELNKKATVNPSSLKDSLGGIKHPFLREAIELVANGILNEREIRDTLEQRLKTIESRYMYEANMFRTIGRFPPALGLLATTFGMIAVLQTIGKPGSEKLIGPAMSIGLVGTLYGIGLANLVFLPIAENLTARTEEEMALRKLIVEGACLIKTQVNPISARENLNSFLLPKDRVVKKAAS